MNIIFLSRLDGRARTLNLSHPFMLAVIGMATLGLLAGSFALGLQFGARQASGASLARKLLARPLAEVSAERKQLAVLRGQMQDRIDALAMRLGVMQANMLRLNALGNRLTQMAHLSSSEFDFSHNPPLGGPGNTDGESAQIPSLTAMINGLSRSIDERSAQLHALQNVLLGRQLSAEIRPSGRPVVEGYISSPFGERIDPFTGLESFHPGIDFAAPRGSDVLAVASGIVSRAGPDGGFGDMVEIDHGDGYSTLYGHNEKLLVHVGEQVQRGQVIALVGSTGRSTGPHVHFEVLRHNDPINPARFVRHRPAMVATARN